MLRKAGANWVDGDRFYDRTAELGALEERVRDGTHTLLTAQRRMGKTSLVRELLRRLEEEGHFATVFVDLEDAKTPEDAIAEIALRSRSVQGAGRQVLALFDNVLQGVADRVDAVGVPELQVKLRAGVDAGNWRRKGDGVFAALAASDRPVVLALDELPILVNRLLQSRDHGMTSEGTQAADSFLSWLRKNGQAWQGCVRLIVSGSVGLEPILHRAGLSAQANILSPFDLRPWDARTAGACLAELAATYALELPEPVRHEMCQRLGCQVPHHVQRFFDCLHQHLRRHGRDRADIADVDAVYEQEMLGVRGQMDLEHYESRLKMVLGSTGYRMALELLTEAAVAGGRLESDVVDTFHNYYETSKEGEAVPDSIRVADVLRVLEHDGYLDREGDGYCFVSRLVQDWWLARYGTHFVPIAARSVRGG